MKNFLIALVVIVFLGGAYYLWQGGTAPDTAMDGEDGTVSESGMPVPDPSGMSDVPEMVVNGDPAMSGGTSDDPSAPMSATVTFNGTSFSPAEVTVAAGGTVTWVNASTGDMWVASDVHPSHTVYSGTSRGEHCPDPANTSFDQCAPGGDYSFTFDKAGSWRYHDHLTPSASGVVIVE